MTKGEETALRDEVAELRKQLSAIAVAIAELAAKTPTVIYQSYPVYQPTWPTYVSRFRDHPWPITCGGTAGSGTFGTDVISSGV